MKGLPIRSSFQKKLMTAFLLVGVLPLLVCVLLILNVFRFSLQSSSEANAESQLETMTAGLGERLAACGQVLEELEDRTSVARALAQGEGRDTRIYNALYNAAAPLLRDADFSLYDGEGRRLYTTGSGEAVESLDPGWGVLFAAREERTVVCRAVSPYEGTGRGGLRLARAIYYRGQVAGYAVARVGEEHLSRLFEGKYSAGSDVLVVDPRWNQVYASPTLQDEGLSSRLRSRLLEGLALAQAGEGYTYHVLEEGESGFLVILRQSQPMADWVLRLFYLAAGVSLLLCILVCLRASVGFSRQLFQPIWSLNNAMAAVEEGELDVRVEVTGADEISQLSGRFNRMTQRLKENLEDSIRQQQELGEAQIRMMQAQLNPHFLYNTLDTLKWLGKINRVPEVATISADLADILRSSISGGEFVALREEVELLERYVEIQSLRFPGKFVYTARIPEELLDARVPKLMLQPLVENAIIHGFEDGSHGHVEVLARRRGEELELTVRDDGCGMSPESMERFLSRRGPQGGRHFGLYNVDAILRLHYGPDRGLRFQTPEGGKGTCIQVCLPLRGGEEEGL